jgi:hypothetical protein
VSKRSDRPVHTQEEFFARAIESHNKVESIERLTKQVYRVNRVDGLPPLTVYVGDIYTVGEADMIEITSEHEEVNCVVAVSNWNEYTQEAKKFGMERKIGLFTFTEFMGALNWTQFWKYYKK